MTKRTLLNLGLLTLVMVFMVNMAYSQNINTFFSDMANTTNTGAAGVKLLAGRILGVVLILVLAIFVGSIWLKPEYSKTVGVSFLIGALLYWGCVQIGWLAV